MGERSMRVLEIKISSETGEHAVWWDTEDRLWHISANESTFKQLDRALSYMAVFLVETVA